MTSAPATKRQRQAQTTRARIFDIAAALISERGFDNVTVDQICAQAGVAKGGFYHHFASKDEIVIETYRQIDGAFNEALGQLPEDAPARRRILFTTRFMAETARDKGAAYTRQIYRSQVERGTSFFISPERPFYATLAQALRQGAAGGEFAGGIDQTEATRMILSVARGVIYDWSMVDGGYDIVAFMERTITTMLDGLANPA